MAAQLTKGPDLIRNSLALPKPPLLPARFEPAENGGLVPSRYSLLLSCFAIAGYVALGADWELKETFPVRKALGAPE